MIHQKNTLVTQDTSHNYPVIWSFPRVFQTNTPSSFRRFIHTSIHPIPTTNQIHLLRRDQQRQQLQCQNFHQWNEDDEFHPPNEAEAKATPMTFGPLKGPKMYQSPTHQKKTPVKLVVIWDKKQE